MQETEKHLLILNAAAALFAKYGYKKTTIDEIVAEAGISKGLFYHYYQNKKQLYLYIYDLYTTALSECVKKEIDTGNTDFFDRLKQVSRLRVAFINQYPDLWNFLYTAYYEQHPDVASEIKGKNKQLIQESYSGTASNIDWSKLRDDISPDTALTAVTWLAEGFVREVNHQKLVFDEKIYSEFDKYIELLRTGLCKPKNGG
ncbi:MAG: TetR/AcrR family transcriptional regulator [Lachnospiraceae bacterium]|nr:TetR/AcrR family transcriptional regulator [Lachnospiraceae bacterium]